jgi:UDPglucose 6-dehydrogenase
VSAACFADFGGNVACVDNDKDRIRSLRAGRMPIYEPGLDQLVNDNDRAGLLHFSDDMAEAVASV